MNEQGNLRHRRSIIPVAFGPPYETIYKRADMITESLIIACIVCIGLSLLAYIMKSLPLVFISSIGWLICGLKIFQQTEDMLPMMLLFVFAFGQFMLIKKEAA